MTRRITKEIPKRMTKEEYMVLKEQRKRKIVPLTINGYSPLVENSGDVLCTHICFNSIEIIRLVVVVKSLPEKEMIDVVVNVSSSKTKTERTLRFPVTKGEHRIKAPMEKYLIEAGSRIAVSVEYTGAKPHGVWVAAYGDQLL